VQGTASATRAPSTNSITRFGFDRAGRRRRLATCDAVLYPVAAVARMQTTSSRSTLRAMNAIFSNLPRGCAARAIDPRGMQRIYQYSATAARAARPGGVQ
jgi:hypothetical protein